MIIRNKIFEDKYEQNTNKIWKIPNKNSGIIEKKYIV